MTEGSGFSGGAVEQGNDEMSSGNGGGNGRDGDSEARGGLGRGMKDILKAVDADGGSGAERVIGPPVDADGAGGGKVPPGEKKRKGRRKAGPSEAEIQLALVDALEHRAWGFGSVVEFPETFLVLSDRAGVRACVKRGPEDVCWHVHDCAVVDALLAYCHGPEIAPKIPFTMDNRRARVIVELWKSLAPVVDEKTISPVREKNEGGLCWSRLPWDLDTTVGFGVFQEMLGRMSCPKAVMAWIGSLLDADAPRQQYIWIYGEGMNGKGALIDFLRRVMGPAFRSEITPERGNRFWTSGLLGSRLVVFPDCTDFQFPTTGLFKALTGNDAVKVEEKGKPAMTVGLESKFLFASNKKPNLSSTIADRRRAIYCEMVPIPDGVGLLSPREYGRRLWNEGPGFLAACRSAWQDWRESGQITYDTEGLDALIESNEEDLQDLFTKFFVRSDDLTKPWMERSFVRPQDLLAVLRDARLSNQEVMRFKAWLERRMGVKRLRAQGEAARGCRDWRYVGIDLRPEVKAQFQRVIESETRF